MMYYVNFNNISHVTCTKIVNKTEIKMYKNYIVIKYNKIKNDTNKQQIY